MSKRPSLTRQVQEALEQQKHFGNGNGGAKRAAKAAGTDSKYIYSGKTFRTYLDQGVRFVKWAKIAHPDCKMLEDCKPYRAEYLDHLTADGKSAHTVKLACSALNKLYQDKLDYTTPHRARENITRSRVDRKSDRSFAPERHPDLVNLCECTGLRRHELAALRTPDIVELGDNRIVIHVRRGKGGKERFVEAAGTPEQLEQLCRFLEQKLDCGDVRVIDRIPAHMDVHSYRSIYAGRVYRANARDVSALPETELYRCRGDKRGVVYDRKAMLAASRMLGHNRVDVVASNYSQHLLDE